MHHSSSRFYLAPRSLIIERNTTPFYDWYITSLCWNIRWKPILVLIYYFLVFGYQLETVLVLIPCLCSVIVMQIVTSSANKTCEPKPRIENASVYNL